MARRGKDKPKPEYKVDPDQLERFLREIEERQQEAADRQMSVASLYKVADKAGYHTQAMKTCRRLRKMDPVKAQAELKAFDQYRPILLRAIEAQTDLFDGDGDESEPDQADIEGVATPPRFYVRMPVDGAGTNALRALCCRDGGGTVICKHFDTSLLERCRDALNGTQDRRATALSAAEVRDIIQVDLVGFSLSFEGPFDPCAGTSAKATKPTPAGNTRSWESDPRFRLHNPPGDVMKPLLVDHDDDDRILAICDTDEQALDFARALHEGFGDRFARATTPEVDAAVAGLITDIYGGGESIAPVEAPKAGKRGRASRADLDAAEARGGDAFRQERGRDTNPYGDGTQLAARWERGWALAQGQVEREEEAQQLVVDDLAQARRAGKIACAAGQSRSSLPHALGSGESLAWLEGYDNQAAVAKAHGSGQRSAEMAH